jgi:Bcr/CflA subfamily drug resistance transporter
MIALASLTAAGPLAIDMYIPGFPAMAETLGVSTSAIQLTMTAFLAGIVLGQLVVGPISDGIGRRKLLLAGTLAFSLLSVACALAPTVELLTVFRFLHGACGAIGMVLARAVLTDRFGGPRLPRMFALLSQIMGLAPVIAPVLGGLVLSVGSWRTVFFTLAGFGILQFLLVLILVPESLPPERRHGGGLVTSLGRMGALLRQRSFVGYMLVLGANGAALFSYIAGSSFVFEGVYHVSETQYSLIFASNALGLVLAGQVFARLSRRILLNRLLIMAVSWCVLISLVHWVLALTVGDRLAITWICLFLTMFGVGFIFPSVNTIAQMIGRETPGSASALMGSTQFLCAAAASPLLGILGHDSSAPMAMVMLFGFCAAGLALLVLARPWLGLGEVARTD